MYTVCVCVWCDCVSLFHSPLFRPLPPPWHSANNFQIIVKSVRGMGVHSGYSKVVAVCVDARKRPAGRLVVYPPNALKFCDSFFAQPVSCPPCSSSNEFNRIGNFNDIIFRLSL
jgi:hypothetical protein